MRGQSGGEDFELLGQRRIRIEGEPRLSLAHHVNHFDAGQDCGCGGGRFEAEHRLDTALDAPMVLLDPIVQILAPADPDRLQRRRERSCKRFVVSQETIASRLVWLPSMTMRSGRPMTLQRLSEEAFGRRQVALLAEIEFDGVADTVDGAIEIHPLATDLDWPRTLM